MYEVIIKQLKEHAVGDLHHFNNNRLLQLIWTSEVIYSSVVSIQTHKEMNIFEGVSHMDGLLQLF